MNFSATQQVPLVKSQFPQSIDLPDVNKSLKRNILLNSPKHSLSKYAKFIELMDKTISKHYITHNGQDWKKHKNLEMQEDGMIYVYYTVDQSDAKLKDKVQEENNKDEEVVAFISFILTLDDGELVLYLYEIHVSPNLKGLGVGNQLIQNFHELIPLYRKSLQLEEIGMEGLEGSKLTVFSDNSVLGWYKKLGYTLADESPTQKTLRSGKVLEPDYYILIRRV